MFANSITVHDKLVTIVSISTPIWSPPRYIYIYIDTELSFFRPQLAPALREIVNPAQEVRISSNHRTNDTTFFF